MFQTAQQVFLRHVGMHAGGGAGHGRADMTMKTRLRRQSARSVTGGAPRSGAIPSTTPSCTQSSVTKPSQMVRHLVSLKL